jgi:predicted fused transcriptional regulator/phosphomethylpyrimidine kinase
VQIQECETETELIYHESLKVTNVIFEPGTYALEPVKVLFANNRNEEIVIEKQLAIRKDNFEKLVQSKV